MASLSNYERNERAEQSLFSLEGESGIAQFFVLAPDAQVRTFTFQMFEEVVCRHSRHLSEVTLENARSLKFNYGIIISL